MKRIHFIQNFHKGSEFIYQKHVRCGISNKKKKSSFDQLKEHSRIKSNSSNKHTIQLSFYVLGIAIRYLAYHMHHTEHSNSKHRCKATIPFEAANICELPRMWKILIFDLSANTYTHMRINIIPSKNIRMRK